MKFNYIIVLVAIVCLFMFACFRITQINTDAKQAVSLLNESATRGSSDSGGRHDSKREGDKSDGESVESDVDWKTSEIQPSSSDVNATVFSPRNSNANIQRNLQINKNAPSLTSAEQKAYYRDHLSAIASKSEWLGEEDRSELKSFLNSKYSEQTELDLIALNALKNAAVQKLIDQREMDDDLSDFIIEMYNNPEHDDLWRDYCIQFLPECHAKKWPMGASPTDHSAMRIIDAIWVAASETDSGSIPGTALLALNRMSRIEPIIDKQRLSNLALDYVKRDDVTVEARISAMQICGQLGQKSVLPTARELAQGAVKIPLRMASIASIGDLGSSADISFLEGILSSERSKYVRVACESALAKIKKRNF